MQENRKMRFLEAYEGWNEGRLTQTEAAVLLGQCVRSIRRHIERFEAANVEAFGYLGRRTGRAGYPQAHCAELLECATHAILGACIDAYAVEQYWVRSQCCSVNKKIPI